MKTKLICAVILVLGTSNAFAKKNCTEQPREKWMSEESFKEFVTKEGYKIRKFKQPGTCYEIYGKDKNGRKIEVYFNPVDGSVKKTKFED